MEISIRCRYSTLYKYADTSFLFWNIFFCYDVNQIPLFVRILTWPNLERGSLMVVNVVYHNTALLIIIIIP